MWARRFLGCILVLTLIAVGGAFALYQWGGSVLVRMATPVGHYQEPPKGSAPDYSKTDSWISNSELNRFGTADPALWLPDGITQNALGDANIFYVHPTTYFATGRWNAPLRPNADTDARSRRFVQSQASAFNLAGGIWAPRYRQAAYGAFLLKGEDAHKALDLAYRDVSAAFQAFLKQVPKDGGIVLAAHSQGSLHLLRLLRDRKDALRGRLVAAYVVGWPVGIASDLPATGLAACSSPDQVGCVMSWQSFKEPENTDLVTDAWVGTRGLTGATRTRDDMLCTNPLSGTKDGAANASANRGTLVPNGDLSNAKLAPGLVGARCDRGFLLIDGDVPNLGPYVLPGNNYHVYDYALFWGSIRDDATRRVAAWNKH